MAAFEAAKTSCSRMRPERPLPRIEVQSTLSSVARRKARGLISGLSPARPGTGVERDVEGDAKDEGALETGVGGAMGLGVGAKAD